MMFRISSGIGIDCPFVINNFMVLLDDRQPFFSGLTKQFFFGLLNESEKMQVVNNAGRIYIGQ
jgi:hypothetical protein